MSNKMKIIIINVKFIDIFNFELFKLLNLDSKLLYEFLKLFSLLIS